MEFKLVTIMFYLVLVVPYPGHWFRRVAFYHTKYAETIGFPEDS